MIGSVGRYLTELSIIKCKGLNLYDFLYILDTCPELKELTYESDEYNNFQVRNYTMNCGAHKIKTDISIQAKHGTFFNYRTAKIFEHFPHLRVLDLVAHNVRIDYLYEELNTCSQNLEDLSLFINGTAHGTSSFTSDIRFPLQKFVVQSNMETDASRFWPFFSSNKLEELTIGCLRGFKDAITNRTLSRLRKLHLFKLPDVKERDIACIISECTQLEHLVIDNCTNVTDYLMNSFPTRNQIKTVDVSYCSRITSDGLTELIKSQGASLVKLIITGCESVHKDTITWAIQQLGKHVVEY
ncbi:hypothetical protein G6F56_010096 [Rhizopus delemar]|nr:hypothetical protein G6F56_010096 [Rhizopus delemar]